MLLLTDNDKVPCMYATSKCTCRTIMWPATTWPKWMAPKAFLGHSFCHMYRLSKPTQLVPPHLSNVDPAYFLVSGLVFTTANEPYLESEYGEEYISEAPVKLLERLYHGLPTDADEQVVVLSQVLANDVTLGYEDIFNVQVRAWHC